MENGGNGTGKIVDLQEQRQKRRLLAGRFSKRKKLNGASQYGSGDNRSKKAGLSGYRSKPMLFVQVCLFLLALSYLMHLCQT